MPFVAFMAKWLTTARGVRRTRPLSSISRCTTTLGNRYAPKKRVGSVTPAQDDGRETCHLGCCSYNGLWVSEPCNPAPHQVLWQQESPCISGKGGPYCKQRRRRFRRRPPYLRRKEGLTADYTDSIARHFYWRLGPQSVWRSSSRMAPRIRVIA